MTEPLLRIEDLSVNFITEVGTTEAVKHISLEIQRGKILALVGESGSGKSVTSLSILRLLAEPPASYPSGKILFSENGSSTIDLLDANPGQLRKIRGNRIAMIFQEPMTSLNPVMSCGRQVVEALRAHKNISKAEAKARAIQWFEKVQLPDPHSVYARYPHQLSGGQKQRVMIAMAMCCEPALLICDEPTTALDVTVQKAILSLIRELQQQQNMGVIFITHDLGVVAQVADDVAIMYRGSIVEQKPASTVFTKAGIAGAEHPYTKALIACRPALHPRGEKLPTVSDFLEGKKDQPPTVNLNKTKDDKLVSVKDLTVRFSGKTSLLGKPKSWFTAVDQVSFDIYTGETLGLVGESGCGKTTLGRTLIGLTQPSSGRILYKDKDLSGMDREGSRQMRREVQLVFQDPYSSLNPRLNIGAAIEEPLKASGMEKDPARRKRKMQELLERVDLSSSMAHRYPHEFSGGQRQRIVIARALAMEPGFLVCDESVSALDVSVQAQVLNLLNELKRDLGLTMLFISHDLSVVRYMSDRIMVMHRGKIVESGPADEVYHHPKTAYTKELINAIPNL